MSAFGQKRTSAAMADFLAVSDSFLYKRSEIVIRFKA
jgi:hypothetical protein